MRGRDAGELPVVRAAELDEPDDQRRWLVESLWAYAGVGVIGGAPKVCKSWLGLDLALSIASGTPCLDRFAVAAPGSALVYLAEDSPGVVKARLAGLCRHRRLDFTALPLDVITAPSLRLDLARDQERLAETVKRRRPRLLLLDPFVRLHRIDENSAGDVSAVLGYLRELQRAYEVAVVVAHHSRKNGPAGSQAGQGLRGSGDFHAWGDSNLYLRRVREDLVLAVEHRAAPSPPDPLRLRLVDDEPRGAHLAISLPTSDPPPSEAPVDVEALVLDALRQAGGALSRPALRAAVRIRNERLGDILARLVAAGRLARSGDLWVAAG